MNNELLKSDLRRDEGEELTVYTDTVGKLTIGVGHNLTDLGISKQVSDVLLAEDIFTAVSELRRAFPEWLKLSEARQRALANMAFNLGVPRLMGFKKMLSAIKEENWRTAADEMLDSKWARQVGQRATRLSKMMIEG